MNNETAAILIIMTILAVITFLMGWDIASTKERNAAKFVKTERTKIGKYVRKNWPNEYWAWRKGHAEGYQQGINDYPRLTEDDDEIPA